MEEKERYEMNDNDCLIDNEQNTIICDFCELTIFPDTIINLLNKQDKHIKELELLLKADKKMKNNSLKGFEKLKQKNKIGDFWHSAYQGKQLEYDQIYTELRKAYEENQQLKQSLEYTNKQLDYFTDKFRGRDFKRTGDWAKDIELYMRQLAVSELEEIYNLFEPYENSQKDTILCANNDISFIDYLENRIKKLKGEE